MSVLRALSVCGTFLLGTISASSSYAGLIQINGDFSFTLNREGYVDQDFVGTFTKTFDASLTPDVYQDQVIDSFSMSPSAIGSVTFDSSTVLITFRYYGGVNVGGVTLGGDGSVETILPQKDDIKISYQAATGGGSSGFLSNALVSASTSSTTTSAADFASRSGSFTVTEVNAVPEPSSLAIFSLGGLGVVAGSIRRRKSRQA